MVNSFKQYLVEEDKTVHFTFGKMNPPTIGHEKLLEKLQEFSGKRPYRVYLSHSQNEETNPLDYTSKVKYVRKMFPRHARQVSLNKNVKTANEALVTLYNEGFNKVVMVVGEEKVREYDILLNKYNGQKGRHGFYNFESIKVVSSGTKDPDLNDSKAVLENIKNNDFTSYVQSLSENMTNKESRRMFNEIRRVMGLSEEKDFKRHVQLEPVSNLREAYIRDNIFELGERVVLNKKDGIVGNIEHLGSNYLIVESKGERWRCWLDDVSKLNPNDEIKYQGFDVQATPEGGVIKEQSMYKDKPDWGTPESTKKAKKITPGQTEAKTPQDPDIDDRKGTQPKRYHAGLSKATKIARDRQFKKQSKMADDDPNAYKPAPGDKTAKTKPSKHTKFVNKLMGEQSIEMAKDRINRDKEREREQDRKEKEQMKKRHDRIMDRARRSRMLQKNKGISND